MHFFDLEFNSAKIHFLDSRKVIANDLESDSLFYENVRFRIQSRVGYQKADGAIRRMRLKLDRFTYDPKFGYTVKVGFYAGALGVIKVNSNENLIFGYANKNWT